jgi:SPP1 gp7 family putative phage head morphogenesis protein
MRGRPVAPKRDRLLPAIRPSAALEAEFRKRLDALIAEMQTSLVHWIEAAYRAKPPEMAGDMSIRDAKEAAHTKYESSPSMVMQRVMTRLSRKWQKRFNEAAPMLAEHFTTEIAQRSDRAMIAGLKKSGFAIKFKMTAEMNDVLRASMNEQVSLIKNLATQHLQEIEGLVMRSIAQGGALGDLSKELQRRYGITRRRSELISRDQNAKANATMTRVRQQSIGIDTAVWKHSHAGKTPRPSHLAADGQEYKVKEGMLLDGKMTWPGVEINCRCFSRPVINLFKDTVK